MGCFSHLNSGITRNKVDRYFSELSMVVISYCADMKNVLGMKTIFINDNRFNIYRFFNKLRFIGIILRIPVIHVCGDKWRVFDHSDYWLIIIRNNKSV